MRVTINASQGKEIIYDSRQGRFNPWREMHCIRCGTCCRRWQPRLDESELTEIAGKLNISKEEFCEKYLDTKALKWGMLLIKQEDNGCIFLLMEDDKATCRIHQFKPGACNNWIPNLTHRECRTGLNRVGKGLISAQDLLTSKEDIKKFTRALKNG